MSEWTKARIGCYWSKGDYSVASIQGGGEPAGFMLIYGQGFGRSLGRYPTLEAAQQAADKHAEAKGCTHNRMIAHGAPRYAWRCADCGYVYGTEAKG